MIIDDGDGAIRRSPPSGGFNPALNVACQAGQERPRTPRVMRRPQALELRQGGLPKACRLLDEAFGGAPFGEDQQVDRILVEIFSEQEGRRTLCEMMRRLAHLAFSRSQL